MEDIQYIQTDIFQNMTKLGGEKTKTVGFVFFSISKLNSSVAGSISSKSLSLFDPENDVNYQICQRRKMSKKKKVFKYFKTKGFLF